MNARMLGVVWTAATREQIPFVERERFADGERAAFVNGLAGLPPCQRADQLLYRARVWATWGER
jgi:hypothetical protein